MMTIYHNPRCRKSRETLAIIEEAGETMQVVEYLKMPLSKDSLREVIDKLGITPEDLIRKGETIYKEKYKGKDLSDSEWLDAMVEHPILMERPIVVKDDRAIIGRPPEKVKELF